MCLTLTGTNILHEPGTEHQSHNQLSILFHIQVFIEYCIIFSHSLKSEKNEYDLSIFG